jgi:hypothetical protein
MKPSPFTSLPKLSRSTHMAGAHGEDESKDLLRVEDGRADKGVHDGDFGGSLAGPWERK